ncbi:hypothetical protein [Flavobacterium capsici]|uniref:Peptidyl-prolyl cis-trans isomerase n=1 Tax=Flavobacterium capsici TaxID=3075618 RepID=A0AA96EV51_9FLAO|nr:MULTISPECIES: hypothetical protein [unclassified Flavobacterium]WNM19044.1 hypothetical protein RN608_13650 [Flavobacterium sp. PMR2A8]WNM23094.1 hypothetical protein RN605_06950 [Flavobacterium sp. PMTSA4]
MNKAVLILFFSSLLCSCNWFKEEQKPDSIARVGKNYLYKTDIQNIVPKGTSKEDSIIIITSFIDRWATQKLLIEAAERNLDDKKKKEYSSLINQYKIDLYTKAYIEEIVKRSVDTLVTNEELKKYFSENKENFKTNGNLVRLRYINLSKDNPKLQTIKDKFFNFSKKDAKFWDTNSLQFKSFAFNDSIWVDMGQVYDKLPIVNPDNRDELIQPGKKLQILDKDDLYLVKINNVIAKNQLSPFEYIKPTLKEIIVNKRKLELIKKFEKEITEDAIKNKNYEIYK